MGLVLVVLSVEAIPIGALISIALDHSARRRSGFWLRVVGVALAILAPGLVSVVAPAGEDAALILILASLGWGLVLVAVSRFVLFHGPGFGPGPADDDGDGPGPGDDRPTPPPPTGGIPLLDAGPAATRLRDQHRRRRSIGPRRPVRERRRRVPHMRLLRHRFT
jgi:hypothetical protein